MTDLITTLSQAPNIELNIATQAAAQGDQSQKIEATWVHLLPSGHIGGRDGRSFNLINAQDVINKSMTGVDLPIDYEHAIDTNPQARAIPAAGWVKELQAREDGIWGRVEWTDAAHRMIAGKEYRYLSPVLMYDAKSKEVHRIIGAALVHRPNLNLKALSSEHIAATPIEDALTPIRLALGLNEQADAAAIIEALGVNVTPDPRKYVPIEAMKELFVEATSIKAYLAETEAEARVTAAMNQGHLTPAMRGWALALCARDPDSFDNFVNSSSAPYAHLFEPSKLAVRDPFGSAAAALNAEDSDEGKLAKMLGIDPSCLK